MTDKSAGAAYERFLNAWVAYVGWAFVTFVVTLLILGLLTVAGVELSAYRSVVLFVALYVTLLASLDAKYPDKRK